MKRRDIYKACDNFITAHKLYEVDYGKLADACEDIGYTVIEFNKYDNEQDVDNLIDLLHLNDKVKYKKCFIYAAGDYRLIFVREDLGSQEKLLVLAQEAGRIALGLAPVSTEVQDEFDVSIFADRFLHQSGLTHFKMGLYHHRWSVALAALICLLIIIIGGIIFLRTSKIVFIGDIPKNGETAETGTDEETVTETAATDLENSAEGVDRADSAPFMDADNSNFLNLTYLSGTYAAQPDDVKQKVEEIACGDTDISETREKPVIKRIETETGTENDTETETFSDTTEYKAETAGASIPAVPQTAPAAKETEPVAQESEAPTAQNETIYVVVKTPTVTTETETTSVYVPASLPSTQESTTRQIIYGETSAYVKSASGAVDGTDLTWTVNNHCLTISGKGSSRGDMVTTEITDSNGKVIKTIETPAYLKKITEDCSIRDVIIEEGVTDICSGFFYGIGSVTSVTLPSTLKTIYKNAFYGQGFTMQWPSSVDYVDDYAFAGFTGTITGAISSEHIGSYAFYECYPTGEYWLTDDVDYIGDEAFGPAAIYLPSNLDYLGTMGVISSVYVHKGSQVAKIIEQRHADGWFLAVYEQDKYYWE